MIEMSTKKKTAALEAALRKAEGELLGYSRDSRLKEAKDGFELEFEEFWNVLADLRAVFWDYRSLGGFCTADGEDDKACKLAALRIALDCAEDELRDYATEHGFTCDYTEADALVDGLRAVIADYVGGSDDEFESAEKDLENDNDLNEEDFPSESDFDRDAEGEDSEAGDGENEDEGNYDNE